MQSSLAVTDQLQPSSVSVTSVRMGVIATRLQPPLEPCGVRVDAVERLELLALGGIDADEVVAECVVERGRDVTIVAPRRLGDLGPARQRLLGFGEDLARRLDQPVVRERDAGGTAIA